MAIKRGFMGSVSEINSNIQINLNVGAEEYFQGGLTIVNQTLQLVQIIFDSQSWQIRYRIPNQAEWTILDLGYDVSRLEMTGREPGQINLNFYSNAQH